MSNKYFDCPCGTNVFYHKCCGRYHKGELPENALLLMRSRYAAYAVGVIDYIVETTHKENKNWNADLKTWKDEIRLFSDSTRFHELTIIDFTDGDKTATVTFKATLKEGNKDMTFTERSTFEKVDGRWLYRDGEIVVPPLKNP